MSGNNKQPLSHYQCCGVSHTQIGLKVVTKHNGGGGGGGDGGVGVGVGVVTRQTECNEKFPQEMELLRVGGLEKTSLCGGCTQIIPGTAHCNAHSQSFSKILRYTKSPCPYYSHTCCYTVVHLLALLIHMVRVTLDV